MHEVISRFETTPSNQSLADISGRLAFVRNKIAELEISTPTTEEGKTSKREELDTLRKEITEVEQWLNKFNLRTEGRKTPEKMIAALNAGLSHLNLSYNLMYSDDASLATYLYTVSRNAELFTLYKNYLLSLDRAAGNVFQGINPTLSPDEFVKAVREEIAKRFSEDSVRDARVAWTTEYYPYAMPSPEEFMRMSDRERNAYDRIAMLDPMIAVAFRKFYHTAIENNVFGTPEEAILLKKLIVQNAARLYGLSNLNPLLVAQYFETLAHIAEICHNNPNAFFQEISVAIAPSIDTLTRPVFDATSPQQLQDSNVTRIINRLDRWFSDLQGLTPALLSQYDRYTLLDRTVRINQTPPHDIRSLPPDYKLSLVESEPRGTSTYPPYPLPMFLITVPPSPSFTLGGVATTPTSYQSSVVLPSFTALEVASQAGVVGAALYSYLYPAHPSLIPPSFLPSVYIQPLSSTRLLNETMRLFVEWEKPGYSGKMVGGGAAGGVLIRPQSTQPAGSKTTMGDVITSEDRGGGLIGSYITPTGGVALGASETEEGRTFAGVSANGLPLGKVPILGRVMHKEHELDLDSLAAGIQTTDTIETKRRIISTALTVWDPENPGAVLFNLNNEETKEGKSWTNWRYFYVDKEGTIFELKGQSNDFVELFNYIAGYHDKPFGSVPLTYAWNVETELDRKGGVAAADIGKTALLAHAQSVPFLFGGGVSTASATKDLDDQIAKFNDSKSFSQEVLDNPSRNQSDKDKATQAITDADMMIASLNKQKDALQKTGSTSSMQPMLIEFTLAGGHTVQKLGQTNIYEVSLPGKTLQLPEVTESGGVELGRAHYVQDIVFTGRFVTSRDDAWQITAGGGFALLPIGKEDSRRAYRAGVFIKDQSKHTRAGGGLYYEAMATNFEQTALMQALDDTSEAQRSVESLHRVAATLYGSTEGQNRFLLGGLAHIVPQFSMRDNDPESADYDRTFWRGIGFLRGMDSVARFDVSRRSWIDQMQADYNTLVRDTGQDPRNAAALMSAFKAKYAPEVRSVFNNYYLGVNVTRS
ncbi:TPA: hypothetical protein HA238_01915 [Candidatus Micrarchaeota archaeon]|nr:hypothetical protein [Candidatus Micrarchaeota archaeon]